MRILVVEDESAMARSLARGLEGEGYSVDVAGDGAEGLQLASRGVYDAMILDIMLPKLDGREVLSELRRAGVALPVLMLTAKQGEADQTEALDAGADDFLSKPFSYPVLLARLRALIRRGRGGAGSILAAGGIRLDTGARRCFVDGAEVTLTSREFRLLEHLLRRPGQVVSKAELLDHVWGQGAYHDPNVVEVYVGYLRRKVDRPGSPSRIATVRGAGYRLVTDA